MYEDAVAILTKRNGTDMETLVVYDLTTEERVFISEARNIGLSTHYTHSQEKIIKRLNKRQHDLCGLHNHPNGMPPTMDDGSSAKGRGFSIGVIPAHTGAVFKYSPTDKIYPDESCISVHEGITNSADILFKLNNIDIDTKIKSDPHQINEILDFAYLNALRSYQMDYIRR